MDYMELFSYGVFKQDFYVVAKIDDTYMLLVTIAIPHATFCEEDTVLDHVKEFFLEGYKYKGFFGNLENAMKALIKV